MSYVSYYFIHYFKWINKGVPSTVKEDIINMSFCIVLKYLIHSLSFLAEHKISH